MGYDWDLIERAAKALRLNGFSDIDIHDLLTKPISMADAYFITENIKKELGESMEARSCPAG
jgi:hypothetical protein